MARSATPFSWCTCGGHVVAWTPLAERKAANSADRNSPALSLWKVPTTCLAPSRRLRFSNAVKEAMNVRTAAGALALVRKSCTDLNLTGGVRFGAGLTSAEVALGKRRRRVGSDVRQVAQACGAGVKASVHVMGGVVCRHYADVMSGSRGMEGETPCFRHKGARLRA
eukprot:5594847-Pleurochrysis_carterae.AAC.3